MDIFNDKKLIHLIIGIDNNLNIAELIWLLV